MRTLPHVKILSAAHHRNGVGGVPFWAIVFQDLSLPGEPRMVASLFSVTERGFCAVYSIDELAKGNITFGENSWRGDMYEEVLRADLKEWRKQRGDHDED